MDVDVSDGGDVEGPEEFVRDGERMSSSKEVFKR